MVRRQPKKIEVLLLEDIRDLGKTGELVKVEPGFARNYLLPLQRAAQPSREALKFLDLKKRREAGLRAKRDEQLRELAEAIPQTNVTIEMKVSPDGRLYGSVTAAMVADAMSAAGLRVAVSQVRLEHAIKEIGQFDVPIHVYGDVLVNARLWVVNQP
jgi:large subunit ribosomal protein L9